MLLGMIIGLLLGIVISLAVALWLNRLSNPFVDKGKPIEPLPKIGADAAPAAARRRHGRAEGRARQGPRQGHKPAQAKSRGKDAKPGERPRFEFYQILPGEKEAPRAK